MFNIIKTICCRFLSIFIVLFLSIISLKADTHYVNLNSSNPVSPYTNWNIAATTIQDAVDVATIGDTILVTNGIYKSGTTVTPGYSSLNRVVITKDMTVKSVNGPKITIIEGSPSPEGGNGPNAVRGAYMSTGLLSGFTITNGHTVSSIYSYDDCGGGVIMDGGNGIISNCILTGNSADFYGGGSYKGNLKNCVLRGNTADFGGGSYDGTLNNCVLTGNSADYGGGSYDGTLNNCVLTGNSADFYGGGSCLGTLNNCIIYYNKGYINDNYFYVELNYSCTTPLPSGNGNITNVPMLISSSHIHGLSPCVGAGSLDYVKGVDIDGESWSSSPSIGCDEVTFPLDGALDVSIVLNQSNFVVGSEIVIKANIKGEVSSNKWTIGASTISNNVTYISKKLETNGIYDVVLTAYNVDNPGGVSATATIAVLSSNIYYVDINNLNPIYPFNSWETAAVDIQDAVNIALPGSIILVSNGIYKTGTTVTPGYSCLNRVAITNDITVKSVNGPDVTIISGAESSEGGNGPNAIRGVYMSAGSLSGFTINNGHTLSTGDIIYDKSGGGVNMYGGNGVVSNCILKGNSAIHGGGSYDGTLNNCILTDNLADNDGGGSYIGTLNNCVLTSNSADNDGGGSCQGTLNNCILTGNSARSGGGTYGGMLNNCIIYYNSASYDKNYKYGILVNCCTTPLPVGFDNITNAPILINSSHIHGLSPCVGAGSSLSVTGVDIDGESWSSSPSIGCDEISFPLDGALDVSIVLSQSNVVVGSEILIKANINGEVSSNNWTFGDSTISNNVTYISKKWETNGIYDVVLTAFNEDNPEGVSATATITVFSNSYFYVDINNPNPVYPFNTWEKAAKNIQDAVNVAIFTPGSIVWVSNGIYKTGTTITPGFTCLNRVVITNEITVQSVNGYEGTIIEGSPSTSGGNGSNAVRGVYMSAGSLSGFTITNGHSLTIGDEYFDQSGGGVNMYGGNGNVSNCLLKGNSAINGGGSAKGTLNNCILTGNSAENDGGGSFSGILNNCILTRNSAETGGGSSKGILNNCTLTGNSAAYGGGSSNSILNNCIIYYNRGYRDDNYSYGELNYCCTTPLPSGNGNITNAPLLINSSHIHGLSPCVGAGSSDYVKGVDIDGESWSSSPSIGCDELRFPLDGALDVSIILNLSNVVVGSEILIKAIINGEVSSNHWTFGDSSISNNVINTSKKWEINGIYDVVLTAYNNDNPGGVSATATVTVIVNKNYYVDINNQNPIYPFNSWGTAAKTIQDAVNVAIISGSIVWVTNGIYKSGATVTPGFSCMNRVVITNDITVKSVNGPEVTIIDGSPSIGWLQRVRGVYMSAGSLSGFTITNCHTTMYSGHTVYDQSGGGVNMYGGNGIVSNCILTGNSASYSGGGASKGTLNNCILTDNLAYNDGGGSSEGILNNCILTGNRAYRGGGSSGGVLNNCIIYYNNANSIYNINNNYFGGSLNYSCTYPSEEENCVTNKPEFINRESSDFRLKTSSFCIDAGKNQKWMNGTTDIAGNKRIMNGNVDIGAYEFFYKTDLKVLLEGGLE